MQTKERLEPVWLVNLSTQRIKKGISQMKLAELIPSSQPHVSRVETGKTPTSFSFALRCAEIVGPLLARMDGKLFVIKPADEQEPTKEDTEFEKDASIPRIVNNWPGNAVNSAQQAKELADCLQQLGEHIQSIIDENCNRSDPYLVKCYKEAREAQVAIGDLIADGKRKHPHLVKAGFDLARRVAQASREGRCPQAELEAVLASIMAPQQQAV